MKEYIIKSAFLQTVIQDQSVVDTKVWPDMSPYNSALPNGHVTGLNEDVNAMIEVHEGL